MMDEARGTRDERSPLPRGQACPCEGRGMRNEKIRPSSFVLRPSSVSKRSLLFYWRTNLGVLLAVVVAASVLTGALAVGDSVRHSLKMMVTARLGTTQFALVAQDRFFRAKLADELAAELNTPVPASPQVQAKVAPVLQLRGLIANSDGTRRANKIQVLGVDERFFLLKSLTNRGANHLEGIVLNEPLAERLGVGIGNEVVLRVEKPSLMPREAPFSTDSDLSLAFRLKVSAIADQSNFGLFNLQANQIAPLNVFVPMQWLQEKLNHPAQANMLLIAEGTAKNTAVEKVNQAIKKCWQLSDTGLELRQVGDQLEIRSRRIFIDKSLAETATNA
jgi:putative ABC transport system permease protein